MLIELTDIQVKNLVGIISNAQILGKEAGVIVGLVQALNTPVKKEKETKEGK